MKMLRFAAAFGIASVAVIASSPGFTVPFTSEQSSSQPAAHGARCDGSTDDTVAIAAAARSATGLVIVPSGCLFSRTTLLSQLPPDAIILDLSIINGFASEGETTKSLGVLSKDSATNDTQWLIGSGHHPVLNLNNFGASDTDSSSARRASLLWSVGDFLNGASKTGYRGAGILQFGRETGRQDWSLSLRSLAPWRAIAGGYEMWAPGERIAGPGVFRSTGQAMLVSATGGVTGRAAPAASYGQTVADGTVTWRFIDSTDRSIMRISEEGRVLFGLGDFSATFRHKVSLFQPGNNVSEWAASGPSGDVLSKLLPTDRLGTEVAVPALRASATSGLSVVDGRDYATPIVQFDSSRGLVVTQMSVTGATAKVGSGSINVTGQSLLFVASNSKQTIERLLGGNDGQVLTLHFLDGNSVLANGIARDRIHLQDGQALAATTDTVLVLRRLPSDLGGRWVETGRSVK
ncbi:MAG: hypothetical protein H0W74_10860 [Sphingosinicella sp.]|nr:hypothetical protein [Sphingosinicella sp.]